MNALAEMPEPMLVGFTQIDYDREMALIAITSIDGSEVELASLAISRSPTARAANSRWLCSMLGSTAASVRN
jgi:hypothetical protein